VGEKEKEGKAGKGDARPPKFNAHFWLPLFLVSKLHSFSPDDLSRLATDLKLKPGT